MEFNLNEIKNKYHIVDYEYDSLERLSYGDYFDGVYYNNITNNPVVVNIIGNYDRKSKDSGIVCLSYEAEPLLTLRYLCGDFCSKALLLVGSIRATCGLHFIPFYNKKFDSLLQKNILLFLKLINMIL